MRRLTRAIVVLTALGAPFSVNAAKKQTANAKNSHAEKGMGHRSPARYIVVGVDADSAKLLTIGTVVKGDAALLGKTIFVQPGFTHSVPLSGLVRLGYAEITIGKDSAPSEEVEFDAE